ncbi:VOC family protein [Amycolatopsis jejuensis]|uniref:VOC family protein n=1 Tax=Amycolatopsis jejuensis TaxID=330084 RepID=UPI00068D14F2|nr:VOC family protein [Amycolatopsis jejuensis]
MPSASPVPDDYPVVIPSLTVEDIEAALGFYAEILDAREDARFCDPQGRILYAEITIGGNGVVTLNDSAFVTQLGGPPHGGHGPVSINVYVPDVDATMAAALLAGAEQTAPVADFPDGDRFGGFRDPSGIFWAIASRRENLTAAEKVARLTEAFFPDQHRPGDPMPETTAPETHG